MAIFPSYIHESNRLMRVHPHQLDALWAEGWRHFGTYFFRYSWALHQDCLCMVVPLRLDLTTYRHSKRHRKIGRKNAKFRYVIKPVEINEEKHQLFEKHKQKFTHNVPQDIFVFLSHQPDKIPNPAKEISVYDQNKLIACSIFDEGCEALSSVYAMYDPAYSSYSLGIYTMLLEIAYAQQTQKKYYYHGYCYDLPSMYDYKKRFSSLEIFDWSRWRTPENVFMTTFPKRLYHLVSLRDWDLRYHYETKITPFGEDFIHCSYAEQVARTANKYFSNEETVLVLHIAPERIHSLIKEEQAEDGLVFPHVYGEIPRIAIYKMTEISKNKNGLFEFEDTDRFTF